MAIKGLVADFEENGIKMSTEGFAAKRADHLLPERKRWPPKGQQQVLQQRDQITYILETGDGHQRVRSGFHSKERLDHLLSEDGRWPPKGQQQVSQ